jgi:hypothetical protein
LTPAIFFLPRDGFRARIGMYLIDVKAPHKFGST